MPAGCASGNQRVGFRASFSPTPESVDRIGNVSSAVYRNTSHRCKNVDYCVLPIEDLAELVDLPSENSILRRELRVFPAQSFDLDRSISVFLVSGDEQNGEHQ